MDKWEGVNRPAEGSWKEGIKAVGSAVCCNYPDVKWGSPYPSTELLIQETEVKGRTHSFGNCLLKRLRRGQK